MTTILLIQSTETQGNGTKHYLEERDHKVIWAESGLTGLTALMMSAKETVDLIIIDVALPNSEGLDLCSRFRQRQGTHSIPIILLTSSDYRPDRASDMANGPDDYLAKPYMGSELNERITNLLEGRIRPAERAKGSDLPPAQKLEPLKALGSSVGLALTREQLPALITVSQQATNPDLKLVSNADSLPLRQVDPLPTGNPVTVQDKGRERRPALRLVPKSDAGPSEQPSLAQMSSQKGEENTAKVPVLAQDPAVKQEPDAGDSAPLLPFKVTGEAVIDPATGLFGRPQFEAMFAKEFKQAVRFKQQMSCMLIHMDGHRMEGKVDEALVKAIIGLVQKTIREVDTAAWWTGDSFIVLLPNTLRNDAMQAAARTLEVIATHPFTWPDATKVTISIGVAGLPDKNIDSEQKMIEVADTACRRAQEFSVPPKIDVHTLKR